MLEVASIGTRTWNGNRVARGGIGDRTVVRSENPMCIFFSSKLQAFRPPPQMKIRHLRSADSKNPPTAKCLIQKPTNCSVNR